MSDTFGICINCGQFGCAHLRDGTCPDRQAKFATVQQPPRDVPVRLYVHPLIKQASDVCDAIEKCGASLELTHAVTLAVRLMQDIANYMEANLESRKA